MVKPAYKRPDKLASMGEMGAASGEGVGEGVKGAIESWCWI